MNGFGSPWDNDDADTHCKRCGGPIYFSVGMAGPCPHCHENYEHTDEDLRRMRKADAIDEQRIIKELKEKRNRKQVLTGLLSKCNPQERKYLLEVMDENDPYGDLLNRLTDTL